EMEGMDRTGTEYIGDPGREFNEVELTELASELLEIHSEHDLDRFIGKVLSAGTKPLAGFGRSPAGRALGGILKSAVRRALPSVGTALDIAVDWPAGRMTEGERETLAFEVAKHFVHFAGKAAESGLRTPMHGSPVQAAHGAVIATAKAYPLSAIWPGVAPGYRYPNIGRWIRRGNVITLIGAS